MSANSFLFQKGSTLSININASGVGNISATAGSILLGGTLRINQLNGWQPTTPGAKYVIATATQPIAGWFDKIQVANGENVAGPGLYWTVDWSQDKKTLYLEVAGLVGIPATVAPGIPLTAPIATLSGLDPTDQDAYTAGVETDTGQGTVTYPATITFNAAGTGGTIALPAVTYTAGKHKATIRLSQGGNVIATVDAQVTATAANPPGTSIIVPGTRVILANIAVTAPLASFTGEPGMDCTCVGDWGDGSGQQQFTVTEQSPGLYDIYGNSGYAYASTGVNTITLDNVDTPAGDFTDVQWQVCVCNEVIPSGPLSLSAGSPLSVVVNHEFSGATGTLATFTDGIDTLPGDFLAVIDWELPNGVPQQTDGNITYISARRDTLPLRATTPTRRAAGSGRASGSMASTASPPRARRRSRSAAPCR